MLWLSKKGLILPIWCFVSSLLGWKGFKTKKEEEAQQAASVPIFNQAFSDPQISTEESEQTDFPRLLVSHESVSQISFYATGQWNFFIYGNGIF